MKLLGKIILWCVAGFIAVLIIGAFMKPSPVVAPQQSADAGSSAPVQTAQAQTPSVTIPPDEQNFANIISEFTQQYGQAANDMQKGAIRAQRRHAICAAFKSPHISNWVGTISTLDSTGSGNGVLAVTLNSNLTISTSNNDISDSLDHTTIPAGSALFTAVSQMKTGDTVYFSGDFQPSDDDCFSEKSLTTDGSMQQPEFDFKFTKVKEAD